MNPKTDDGNHDPIAETSAAERKPTECPDDGPEVKEPIADDQNRTIINAFPDDENEKVGDPATDESLRVPAAAALALKGQTIVTTPPKGDEKPPQRRVRRIVTQSPTPAPTAQRKASPAPAILEEEFPLHSLVGQEPLVGELGPPEEDPGEPKVVVINPLASEINAFGEKVDAWEKEIAEHSAGYDKLKAAIGDYSVPEEELYKKFGRLRDRSDVIDQQGNTITSEAGKLLKLIEAMKPADQKSAARKMTNGHNRRHTRARATFTALDEKIPELDGDIKKRDELSKFGRELDELGEFAKKLTARGENIRKIHAAQLELVANQKKIDPAVVEFIRRGVKVYKGDLAVLSTDFSGISERLDKLTAPELTERQTQLSDVIKALKMGLEICECCSKNLEEILIEDQKKTLAVPPSTTVEPAKPPPLPGTGPAPLQILPVPAAAKPPVPKPVIVVAGVAAGVHAPLPKPPAAQPVKKVAPAVVAKEPELQEDDTASIDWVDIAFGIGRIACALAAVSFGTLAVVALYYSLDDGTPVAEEPVAAQEPTTPATPEPPLVPLEGWRNAPDADKVVEAPIEAELVTVRGPHLKFEEQYRSGNDNCIIATLYGMEDVTVTGTERVELCGPGIEWSRNDSSITKDDFVITANDARRILVGNPNLGKKTVTVNEVEFYCLTDQEVVPGKKPCELINK